MFYFFFLRVLKPSDSVPRRILVLRVFGSAFRNVVDGTTAPPNMRLNGSQI